MSFTVWKKELEPVPYTLYPNSVLPRLARLEYGWDELTEWRNQLDKKLQKIDERLEETNKIAAETNKIVAETGKTVAETNKAVADCTGQVQVLAAKSKALERASSELGRLGENFYERHVLEPMIRSIFPLFDLLEDANPIDGEDKDADPVTKLITAMESEAVEFLAQYGIEPYRHAEGDQFDEKTMQPIKIVEAEEEGQDYKIKQSCKSGFKWGQRVLRAEPVILYRSKKAEDDGSDAAKGKE